MERLYRNSNEKLCREYVAANDGKKVSFPLIFLSTEAQREAS